MPSTSCIRTTPSRISVLLDNICLLIKSHCIYFSWFFSYYLQPLSLLVSSHQTLNMLKFPHLTKVLPASYTLWLSLTSQLKFLKFSPPDFSSNSHSFLNPPPSLIWLLPLQFTEAGLTKGVNDLIVESNRCFSVLYLTQSPSTILYYWPCPPSWNALFLASLLPHPPQFSAPPRYRPLPPEYN